MNTLIDTLRCVLAWTWKHTSAGVALVLIVAALFVGYRLGRPAAEPSEPVAEREEVSAASSTQMYTCSMHPTVRLPDPDAKCPICFMDLIPVADDEGSGPNADRRLVLSEAAIKLAEIQTTPVARFFPMTETRLYAKLAQDETRVSRITAWFPGRLESLHIDYVGVPLHTGDRIADIYSPDLLAAFEELRQARRAVTNLASGSALIQETTRQTFTAAREKLRLFGLTPEQIERAEQSDPDSDTFTIHAPIGGVVTHLGVREGDYVETGSPIATVADLSHLWLLAEAYESDLPLLRWGQRVTFTVASLPGETFEGRISFIDPTVDQRTRTASVRIAVKNEHSRLKPGMFATVRARTRLGSHGAIISDELAGKWVGRMHPEIVRDAPGDCPVCGMALVPAESLGAVGDSTAATEPLVIPKSAALITGSRAVVYVKVRDTDRPTFEGREIVLGPRAGDFYIVSDGLAEGDIVVTNGAFKIDSAMQIAAKPSMMSPQGGVPAPGHDHALASGGPRAPPREEVPDHFIFSLKPVYAAYLDAAAALAQDDFKAFLVAESDLGTALSFVETGGVTGESLGTWRRSLAQLKRSEPPASIDNARAGFKRQSDAIIRLLHEFGHRGSQTWRLVHCPMAFDNTGADWVQRSSTIENPYFGSVMLRCGEIRAEFHPIDHVEPRGGATHD